MGKKRKQVSGVFDNTAKNGQDDKVKDETCPDQRNLTAAYRLQVLGMMAGSFAGVLFITCEAMKFHHPVFPLIPILFIGAVCFICSTPIIHISGLWMYPEYRLWQPFQGPPLFILLQTLGWIFFSLNLLLSFIVIGMLYGVKGHHIYVAKGLLAVMGVVSVFACGLITLSLSHFKNETNESNPSKAHVHSPVMSNLPHRGLFRTLSSPFADPAAKTALLLTIASAMVFFSVDVMLYYYPEGHTSPYIEQRYPFPPSSLTSYGCVTLTIAAFLQHCVSAPRQLPSVRLWMPFEGGSRFVLLQAMGWTGLGVVYIVYLAGVGRLSVLPPGYVTCLGPMSLLAVLSLQFSVAHFDWDAQPTVPRSADADESVRFEFFKWTGESVLSLFLATSGVVLFFILDLVRLNYTHSTPFELSLLAGFLLLSAAPTSYVGGLRLYPEFQLWQPFCGGYRFLILQVFGWSVYGATVLMVLVHMTNERMLLDGSLIAIAGFISYLLVLTSLSLFDPLHALDAKRHAHKRTNALFQGEIFVSGLLGLFAWVACVTVDIMVPRGKDFTDGTYSQDGFSRSVLLVAEVLFIAGAIIIQHAGVRALPNYRFFQPFVGGTTYVKLQGVGWFFLAFMIMAQTVFIINPTSFIPAGVLTLCCSLSLLSLMLLSLSLYSFHPDANLDPALADPEVTVRLQRLSRLSDQASDLSALLQQAPQRAVREALSAALQLVQREHEALEAEHLAELPARRPPDLCKLNSARRKSSLSWVFEGRAEPEVVVKVIITVASFALWVMVDLLRQHPRFPADWFLVITCLVSWISPVMSHFLLHRHNKEFKWWRPFEGGKMFVAMQACGLAMLMATTFFLAPVLLLAGVAQLRLLGLVTAAGIPAVVGQLLLVFAHRRWTPRKRRADPDDKGAETSFGSSRDFDDEDYGNREVLVSHLFGGAAVLTLLLLDAQVDWRTPRHHLLPVAVGSFLLVLVALPVSYWLRFGSSGDLLHARGWTV
jgi:hypothetical protein